MLEAETLLKILLAALLGGIIGLEREWSGKGTGLRANILIAAGSTLLTLLSQWIAASAENGNPGQLTAQIVSAVGFLGAGIIIQSRLTLHGLTCAATTWIVAAIGITVGLGRQLLAFLVTVLVILVLAVFQWIGRKLEKSRKGFAYTIKTAEHAAVLSEIKKVIHELAISYDGARVGKGKDGYVIDILLQTSEEKNREFIDRIMLLQQVSEISNENL